MDKLNLSIWGMSNETHVPEYYADSYLNLLGDGKDGRKLIVQGTPSNPVPPPAELNS